MTGEEHGAFIYVHHINVVDPGVAGITAPGGSDVIWSDNETCSRDVASVRWPAPGDRAAGVLHGARVEPGLPPRDGAEDGRRVTSTTVGGYQVYFDGFAVTAAAGVVATSYDGGVFIVSSAGTLISSFALATPTSPVITSGGLVLVGHGPAGAAGVKAYKLSDGTLAWSTPTSEAPADIVLGDDGVAYVAAGSQVIGVDAATGTARHLFTNIPPAQEMLLRDGRLYIAGGGKVTVFSVPATKYDPSSPWPVRFHDNQRTSSLTSGLAY